MRKLYKKIQIMHYYLKENITKENIKKITFSLIVKGYNNYCSFTSSVKISNSNMKNYPSNIYKQFI